MRHDNLIHQPAEMSEYGKAMTMSNNDLRRALVETHQQLLDYLCRKLGNAEDADDVLQSSILRAIKRSEQPDDNESIRDWLRQVLVSSIADHHRFTNKCQPRDALMNPTELEGTTAEINLDEYEVVYDCLYTLLPTLRLDDSELIRSIDLLGEPHEIVAAYLGITINSLKIKLHRARRALKDRLEEMCKICRVNRFLDYE